MIIKIINSAQASILFYGCQFIILNIIVIRSSIHRIEDGYVSITVVLLLHFTSRKSEQLESVVVADCWKRRIRFSSNCCVSFHRSHHRSDVFTSFHSCLHQSFPITLIQSFSFPEDGECSFTRYSFVDQARQKEIALLLFKHDSIAMYNALW